MDQKEVLFSFHVKPGNAQKISWSDSVVLESIFFSGKDSKLNNYFAKMQLDLLRLKIRMDHKDSKGTEKALEKRKIDFEREIERLDIDQETKRLLLDLSDRLMVDFVKTHRLKN